jgi:hypothetical protein
MKSYKTVISARIVAENGDIIFNLSQDVSGFTVKRMVEVANEMYADGDRLIKDLNAAGIDKAVWGGAYGGNTGGG